MSDFEKFVQMVKDANIEFKIYDYTERVELEFRYGYIGFVSMVAFNKNTGKLISIEAYE